MFMLINVMWIIALMAIGAVVILMVTIAFLKIFTNDDD